MLMYAHTKKLIVNRNACFINLNMRDASISLRIVFSSHEKTRSEVIEEG